MPLEIPIGEFNLSRLEKAIFGPGKIQALEGELERRGLKRALVVTADLLADSPLPINSRPTCAPGFAPSNTLGAAGVPRGELGQVAGTIAQALEQSQVMDRPLTREEVVALFEAAY